MEKAGLAMILAGLGAGVLGGVLLGAGATTDQGKIASSVLFGVGGVFGGIGGLTLIVGIPLAAVGNSGAP